MTPIELHRLAGAISCLRPDWPATSLQTFLAKHFTHRPLRDIAVALTYVAVDPTSDKPGRVLEAGPWWQTAATSDVPSTINDCPRHATDDVRVPMRVDPRTGSQICSGCYVDAHEDHTPASFTRRPPTDEARQLADTARATPSDATSC